MRFPDLSRWTRLILSLTLASMILSLSPAAAVEAANNVVITDETITINVLIEVMGASPELLSQWGPAMTSYWNANGKFFTYCGRRVVITTNLVAVPKGKTPSRADYHVVNVKKLRPGQKFISKVRWPGGEGNPGEINAYGHWRTQGGNSDAGYKAFVAHEFGHLLGLGDEYYWDKDNDEHDPNDNDKRDPGEPTSIDLEKFKDANDSIMAWGRGRVLQRHINEIMKKHGVPDRLKDCKDLAYWQGTIDRIYTDRHNGSELYQIDHWILHEELYVREEVMREWPDGSVDVALILEWGRYDVELFRQNLSGGVTHWDPNPYEIDGILLPEGSDLDRLGVIHYLTPEMANTLSESVGRTYVDQQYTLSDFFILNPIDLGWPPQKEISRTSVYEHPPFPPATINLIVDGAEYILEEDSTRMRGELVEEILGDTLESHWDFKRVDSIPEASEESPPDGENVG